MKSNKRLTRRHFYKHILLGAARNPKPKIQAVRRSNALANNQTDQKEPLTFVSLSDDPLDSIREGVGIFQSLTLKHQGQVKIIKPIWPIDTWPDSN